MDLPKASELGVLAVSAAVIILTTCCWLVSRKPSKASRKSSEDSRTFRVRNVPLHWKATDLQTFLAEHSSPTVKSIATEIHSGSNTGTVTFKDVPLPLQASHPWDIPLSLPSEDQPFRDQYLTLDDGFLGITTLYNPLPEDHKVDVIAVSGLGSHAFGSFKERGTDFMWLRDALPYDVTSKDTGRPMARMIVYGHESTVEQSKNMQNLEDMSTSFHDSLLALARAPTVRPIILVAHSLGGLIVKQALISLSKSKNEDDLTLFRAMYGIVFFGVPHDGMQIKSLIPMVGDGPNRFLVESISSINSQILSIQQREFSKALGGQGDSEIICFYETLMSPTARKDEFGEWKMIGPSELLVTKFSATHCRSWEVGPEHICAVARTHSDMVRFRRNDHEYDNVRERLKGLAQRARVRISVSNQTCTS
ncbi:uncharacterized protein BCR38DRAFT_186225 [Pseudomassariella vexata]|uniref:DUF676 domain-containing protein n=1 Tax=Pseudomassariella vexata TaxID=1141098 RepID=A0A1Y2E020_9PEZI|nr:uncharacterized protein BCR38DRAFT_186225 [Pseudomassariella vexata]ORY64882.1 hypothetical protein BCR38DRAFT_186225 [Pseudomassariella vexata]